MTLLMKSVDSQPVRELHPLTGHFSRRLESLETHLPGQTNRGEDWEREHA
jgi:hypothetical protein